MLKVVFIFMTFSCIAQKTEKMPIFHIAPEVVFLYDSNIESHDSVEASDFDPSDNDYVRALGVNLGYNLSKYFSLGIFVSTEEVLSRDLNYNGWAVSTNFGTEPEQNGWAASIKMGGHFG